jgi:hypothetical protein
MSVQPAVGGMWVGCPEDSNRTGKLVSMACEALLRNPRGFLA